MPATSPWCLQPELADIDADGDYDLFGGWDQITYYCNDGSPQSLNFTLVTGNLGNISVGARASPEFIDIDADGDQDLFIGQEFGRIWYYRNDGTAQQSAFLTAGEDRHSCLSNI